MTINLNCSSGHYANFRKELGSEKKALKSKASIRSSARLVSPLSAIYIVAVVAFFFLQFKSDWSLVRIAGLKGRDYGDSYQVISASECDLRGVSQLYDFKPESPECYYTYGSLLLRVLQILNITTQQLLLISLFSISITLVFCFAQVLNLDNWKKGLYLFGVLTSPGVWLLFERGNFDWLIFVLVVIAGYLGRHKWYLASSVVITISALFKFYTFPLLVIPFLFATKRSRLFIGLVGLIALPVCVIEATRAGVGGLVYTLTATYGINFIGLTLNALGQVLNLNYAISPTVSLVLGLIISAMFLLTNKFRLLRYSELTNGIQKNVFEDPIFLLFSSTYIFSYAAGSSYNYRLIFLVGLILRVVGLAKSTKFRKRWILTSFLALWLTYFYAGFDNYLTDALRLTGNLCQYVIFLALAKIVLVTLGKKWRWREKCQ